MAFPSLADELAGAIDGGGARSLAEEFGLDLGYEAGIQGVFISSLFYHRGLALNLL
jgi:hypothetical protein